MLNKSTEEVIQEGKQDGSGFKTRNLRREILSTHGAGEICLHRIMVQLREKKARWRRSRRRRQTCLGSFPKQRRGKSRDVITGGKFKVPLGICNIFGARRGFAIRAKRAGLIETRFLT